MPDMVLNEGDLAPADVPEELVSLVRDALAHLYDYAHLQRHPLVRLLPADGPLQTGRALRALLLDALEQLNPGDAVSRNDREWRPYGILMRRYVDGYDVEQIGAELSISLRQFQRDHRKGLLAVAALLLPRWQATAQDAAPDMRDDLCQEVARLGLAMQDLDLHAVIASVREPLQVLASAHSVHLCLRPGQGPLLALADATLARQALLAAAAALISSGVCRLQLAGYESEGACCVEMAFEPPCTDSQVKAEREARLSAAHQLLQAQGGALSWNADATGMARVQLRFRRAQGSRVLLIDDNESLLRLFERYLAADGFRVDAAASADQAQAALDQALPDAVVLDVMMRQVDGWQLLQSLRTRYRDLPIIVCSVLNEPELAQALGATAYLKKPVSQQQLSAALRQALVGHNLEERHPGER
ncbi:MAG: response regulator transcription factor [Anaerolineae bacterium]